MSKSPASRALWRRPRSAYRSSENSVGQAVLEGVAEDAATGESENSSGSRDTVTDGSGYLLRLRPGWDVPVGPKPAMQLSSALTDRDLGILVAVEQLGMATAEQLARVFFNTHRSAYQRLLALAQKRFLVNVGADSAIVRRAIAHRPPPRNPVYALDWNGAYLLAYEHKHELVNWRPSTGALITTRLGHNLGVSEIWSIIMAAARASHESKSTGNYNGYQLAMAFQPERSSLMLAPSPRHVPTKVADKVLLQPDAGLVIRISQGSPLSEADDAKNGASPRWSPTLDSWRPAFMAHAPSPEEMLWSEKHAASDPSSAYYRTLLLEMETGANDSTDTVRKIKGYNRVIRTQHELWTKSYGQAPRVLVVVPTDRQVKDEALKWRLHYYYKDETAVLLTSLETLSKTQPGKDDTTHNMGSDKGGSVPDGQMSQQKTRDDLISRACWLDVMVDRWRPLHEALGIYTRSDRSV